MRVISGIYKRRRFDVPHSFKARPTTDFAKENLFNVLTNYMDLEVKTDKCIPIRGDVFKYIQSCHNQFDFIFADPPYELKGLETIPDLIFEHGLLKDEGLFVLEHGKKNNFESHPHFIERRVYGSVNFSFFQ